MSCGFQPPPFFPKGCPPEPHSELPGIYYRLVFNASQADEEDFKSPIEQGLTPSGGANARCRDCAISLLDSVEKARNFVKNHPTIGPKHVGRVDLTGGHGVVHRSGDPRAGHFDWWVPQGVSALSFFRGVTPE